MKMHIAKSMMSVYIATFAFLAADAMAKDTVYRWVDDNGVVHFGDNPGSGDSTEVVDIPRHRVTATPEAEKTSAIPPIEEPSYAQKQRDERRKSREEAAEIQQAVDAGCAQRRQIVAQMEPSTRVMVEDEDGNIIRMDDNDRLEMLAEAKSYIAKKCN
jgi:hypothetical protein